MELVTSTNGPDYSALYDQYWASSERIGETNTDVASVARALMTTCGINKALDVGSGEGGLVEALLRYGVDAFGLDVSQVVVDRCNNRIPGRFNQGSVLLLPYGDETFPTVISTDFLEHLAPNDIPSALAEIYRVVSRNVLLQIAVSEDRGEHQRLTIEGRAWWEARCLAAGFRKHPLYYLINDYVALNHDGDKIYILLEKIPRHFLKKYSPSNSEAESGPQLDMLRVIGERSDASVFRYHWACNYMKPQDCVLDTACGRGYGGHVIRAQTKVAEVVGIDSSEYAISYATDQYGLGDSRAKYSFGLLPEVLAAYGDGTFDAIVSFDTLEHVEEPQRLIAEYYRLLTPGGRLIVSIPNGWSDETGQNPNVHIYDWCRLKHELGQQFILEEAFAQTASRCKVTSKGNIWESRPRSMFRVSWQEDIPADCEWWLITAMKSPLQTKQLYQERVFTNVAIAEHPSLRYSDFYINPWLMHAMVNAGYRLKNSAALEKLATDVMGVYPKNSNDYAAALCVRAYRLIESHDLASKKIIVGEIKQFISRDIENSMALRWKVSLLFVMARLFEAIGEFSQAHKAYSSCAMVDVTVFGVHLATKTTEAAYHAGRIAYALGDAIEARKQWQHGVNLGRPLLEAKLEEILLNPEFPNLFNHGDGAREYSVAWDNIARCANGLHLLQYSAPINFQALNNCHQTEYVGVTADLIETRKLLVDRTSTLEHITHDLIERTAELVNTRQELVERTAELVNTRQELVERTAELVNTRQELVERTERLEQSSELLKKK